MGAGFAAQHPAGEHRVLSGLATFELLGQRPGDPVVDRIDGEPVHAAVDQWVEEASDLPDSMGDLLPRDDLRAELTVVARGTLVILRRQQELFSFLARDGSDRSDVLAEVHRRLVRPSYDRVAAYLAMRSPVPLDEDRAHALAAVALGPLVNARHHRALYGEPVAGVDDEALVDAWVDLWFAWLTPR